MSNRFDADNAEFCVLINDERQYSIWPTFKAAPPGWTLVGPRGCREICLNYIEANWTDLRPRSLVESMERDAAARAGMSAIVAREGAVTEGAVSSS